MGRTLVSDQAINRTVGGNILKFRRLRRCDIEAVAKAARMTVIDLEAAEEGKRTLSVLELIAIATAIDVMPSQLLELA